MLFYSEYKNCISKLTPEQKKSIFKSIVIINSVLIAIAVFFVFKIALMKTNQTNFIRAQTVEHQISTQDLAKVDHRTIIDAKVYIFYIKDINLKETTLPLTFALSMTYPESSFNHKTPEIDIVNGTIDNSTSYYRAVDKDGYVNEVMVYDAHVNPHYLLQLYPLDEQIISVRPSSKMRADTPFDIRLSGMYDFTEETQTGDYNLDRLGFINPIESYSIIIGHKDTEVNNFIGRAYMIFDHKNIYTYIKNIQYVILSIAIALFSLLINSRSNSPKNGRVAVIGSSVFSLAANVFQINSTIKPTNALTVIDLITIFAGLVILVCFTITVRTLKLIDSDGYEMSKTFDLAMFYSLSMVVTLFFVLVYIYA